MSVLVLGYIRPELDYTSKGVSGRMSTEVKLMSRCPGPGHPDGREGRSQLTGPAQLCQVGAGPEAHGGTSP